jgi:hypothetical protein
MFYINYATAVVYQLPLVQYTHENTKSFIPSALCFFWKGGTGRCVLNATMIYFEDSTLRGEKRGRTNENMNTTALHGRKKTHIPCAFLVENCVKELCLQFIFEISEHNFKS